MGLASNTRRLSGALFGDLAPVRERSSFRDSYPSNEKFSSSSHATITDSLTERASCTIKKMVKKGVSGLKSSVSRGMAGAKTLSQTRGRRKKSNKATKKVPVKWGSAVPATDILMSEAARKSTL